MNTLSEAKDAAAFADLILQPVTLQEGSQVFVSTGQTWADDKEDVVVYVGINSATGGQAAIEARVELGEEVVADLSREVQIEQDVNRFKVVWNTGRAAIGQYNFVVQVGETRSSVVVLKYSSSFSFQIGNFECTVVSDGTNTYHRPLWLFTNAPKERLEQVLSEHNIVPEQWDLVSPYPSLVINTGRHRVLLDTGIGAGAVPTAGKLLQNLKAEGIEPKDIDTVILTHGHPDHIGGNVDDKGKPAFPNARYVMWKDEWEFWTSETNLARMGGMFSRFARKNLPPIQGQLDLVDHEMEILPGVHAVAASGHTPGHMAVAIVSAGEQLLCVGDAVLHPIHLEQPSWYSTVDMDPEQAVTTRRQLMDRAAAEKALLFVFHFPFPGLGHVRKKGEGWRWQPIDY